jgi:hypothetical protein
MDPVGLTCRLARAADGTLLAHFDCPGHDQRTEIYIRSETLGWHLDHDLERDYRLLVWTQTDGELVAVAAHRRNLHAERFGVTIEGTEIVVVAIAAPYRDSSFAGRPTITTVVEQLFDDIAAQDRGDFIAALVDPQNNDGRRLVERLEFEEDHTRDGDIVFVRIGPHPAP